MMGWSFLSAWLGCLPGCASEPILLERGFSVARVVATGRTAAPRDPLVSLLVEGRLEPPAPGDALDAERGLVWRETRAEPEGFDQRLFSNGYLCCEVQLKEPGTYLLRAKGHGMVYVNGEPRGGDVYGYGHLSLPVRLRAGRNILLFSAGRGRLDARLEPISAALHVDVSDPTVPDLLTTDAGRSVWGAVVVQNATQRFVPGAKLECTVGGRKLETRLPRLPPLSVRKVPFRIPVPRRVQPGPVEARLRLIGPESDGGELALPLHVSEPNRVHRRTFFSGIDGSLQYFAVNPSQRPGSDNALVLSVHGASVEAINQARAYQPKDWLTLVAPTNRRPYGFDWEDWGRMDALEVLEIAKKAYPHDPRRVILTGHSMGGHGTWHIGLTHPSLFAAIGPAAGWISFRTYGGLRDPGTAEDPIAAVLRRAGSPSETLELVRNTLHYGVYILHGDADESVPVSEARRMREALATFHPNLRYFEKPGGTHWWGDDSVDWPEMFDFFRGMRIPDPRSVRRVEFVTANPAVSSRSNWVEILQQEQCLELAKIVMERHGGRIVGETRNVAALALDLRQMDEAVTEAVVDAQTVRLPAGTNRVVLRKRDGRWMVGKSPSPFEKRPGRSGPVRLAFQRRMAFVVGTAGRPEENAWAFAKARFDAEQWQYRGNGAVDVLLDTEATPQALRGRNAIVYGNWSTNLAIARLVDPRCPIRVERGSLRVGDREWKGGGYSALFAFPKAGDADGMVVVIGGTDPVGMRQLDRLPYLAPGVAYPDWLVLAPGFWRSGVDGVAAAGFFSNDWRLDPNQSAFR